MFSTKMGDALTTRQLVTVILMLTGSIMGSTTAEDAPPEDDAWAAPTDQQYSWNNDDLKNEIQHGDVTTFELGTPNYQILNPEDEPEYITEDQPHYREMLRRLTSGANATDTIDLSLPRASATASAGATATAAAAVTEKTQELRNKWEKLQKRSFPEQIEQKSEQQQEEIEALPLDERSRHPKVQVYAGARPFQKDIANLS